MTNYRDVLIRQAGLPERAKNCLLNGGFYCMGEVEEISSVQLLRISNLGKKSLIDIEDWFAKHGGLSGERRVDAVRRLESMKRREIMLRHQISFVQNSIAMLETRLGR